MKIWIVSLGYKSGASVYIDRLEKVLKRHGHNIERSNFSNRYQALPYPLKFKRPSCEPDVVISDVICGAMLKNIGKKIVIIEHHCIFDPAYKPYRTVIQAMVHELLWRRNEKNSLQASDAVVCVSRYTAQSVQNIFGKLPVKVIPNGIETDFFSPDNSQKKSTRKDSRYKILYVGNLIKRKGIDLLPKIMAKLGSQYHLYYTSGLRTNNVLSAIPNATSLGQLTKEQLLMEYQNTDVFLFPSRFEGFGYAPAEAMACGTPVVAAKTSSIPEVVEDGKSGILCDIDDVDGFVHAVQKITLNQALHNKMKKRAREIAVERFSMKQWGTVWSEMLLSLF